MLVLSLVVLVGQSPVFAASYAVTTTADSGSLRQAILDANANPGADTIAFAVGATGSQQTIQPTSALPTITAPVTLNGWSQGGSGNTTIIGTDGDGQGDAIEGNIISGNILNINLTGITNVSASHNNRISGNLIGPNAAGTAGVSIQVEGVRVYVAEDNLIGTNSDGVSDELEGNLISGHIDFGVMLQQTGALNNVVAGNRPGCNHGESGLCRPRRTAA